MHLANIAWRHERAACARPVVGRVAQAANVGRPIVSHIGLFDLDGATADLQGDLYGPLTIGVDLPCAPIMR